MADYKRMYEKLFNAVTDAVGLLMEAQEETERLYTEGDRDRQPARRGKVVPFPEKDGQ
ncbi:MAG: hypothetical protein LBR83_05060 [Clostridiales bacterium]|nr:hypothetical protein [Clostridiales bacterium]